MKFGKFMAKAMYAQINSIYCFIYVFGYYIYVKRTKSKS